MWYSLFGLVHNMILHLYSIPTVNLQKPEARFCNIFHLKACHWKILKFFDFNRPCFLLGFLKNAPIKIVACYRGSQKEFSCEKASVFHFCKDASSSENQKIIFCSKFFYNIESKDLLKMYSIVNFNMLQF